MTLNNTQFCLLFLLTLFLLFAVVNNKLFKYAELP